MMKTNYCSKCGGTGKTVNGKFCTCAEGRQQKEIVGEPQPKYQKPNQEAAQTTVKDQEPKKTVLDYVPGDWVIPCDYDAAINGVLCEVLEVNKDTVQIAARGVNNRGKEVRGTTTLNACYVMRAGLEGFENINIADLEIENLKRMIDRALQANDREKFHELASLL